jgi:hypothetical protein
MSTADIEPFFKVAAALCAAFAILWAFRIRSKGSRAIVMSLAFLMLGTTAMLVVQGATQSLLNVGIGLTIFLLVIEFLLRARAQSDQQ